MQLCLGPLGKCWELMAKFHLLKIRTSIDILNTEKCKVTFGLKYIIYKQYNINSRMSLKFSQLGLFYSE